MHSSVTFRILIKFCSHYYLISENFNHLPKKVCTHPSPLLLALAATTNLLSVLWSFLSWLLYINNLYNMCASVPSLFHLAYFLGSPSLWYEQAHTSLLWWDRVPFYGYTTFCSFVHQLTDKWNGLCFLVLLQTLTQLY